MNDNTPIVELSPSLSPGTVKMDVELTEKDIRKLEKYEAERKELKKLREEKEEKLRYYKEGIIKNDQLYKNEVDFDTKLNKLSKCQNISTFQEILSKIFKLKRVSIQGMLPVEALTILSCYFKTNVQLITDINKSITELKLLKFGYQGSVYDAEFNKIKDAIVIKLPNKDRYNSEMFHEYFVGITCTNKLRFIIPNFAWIYGYIQCKGFLPGSDWCGSKDGVLNLVIYEKILGNTIGSVIGKINFPMYFSYLLQITFALDHANRGCKFTHYDLHPFNIILRESQLDECYIKYFNSIYVRSNKIATIIDFARSTVNVDNKWYGISGFEFVNHHSDKDNPCYDIFKFIGQSFDLTGKGNGSNKDVNVFCGKVLTDFFGLKFPDDFVIQSGIKWSYPGNKPIIDFIVYLKNNFKKEFEGLIFEKLSSEQEKKVICVDELCMMKLS